MIYTKRVRVRIRKDQIRLLNARNTSGIEYIWHFYDNYKNEAVVQLKGSDFNNGLDKDNPVYKEDIEKELNYLNKIIVQDGVRTQKETPNFLGDIQTFVNHPRFRGEYDYIQSKFKNVYELKVPVLKLHDINQHYEKRGLGKIDDIKGVIDDPNLDAPEKFKRRAIVEVGTVEDGFNIQKM